MDDNCLATGVISEGLVEIADSPAKDNSDDSEREDDKCRLLVGCGVSPFSRKDVGREIDSGEVVSRS